ncbi:MAG: membrane protein insertase YidC [Candidatus Omnitrophica bacterium]|nr:membrane protein insertase YidC [Candidatus Omnitrophota bacterium]MDD5592483.1 membrane protein insertase YidC [Candidatus Omnitrophota bacterium]
MDRRLILAIALSLLVLLSWSALVSKTYNIDNKGVTQNISAPGAVKPVVVEALALPKPDPITPTLLKFSQAKYDLIFNESQAAIQEVVFKSYQDYAFPIKYGLLSGDANLVFRKESITPQGVNFIYRDNAKQITKRFVAVGDYEIRLEITAQNLSGQPLFVGLPLTLGVLNFAAGPAQSRLQDLTIAAGDKIVHSNLRKEINFSAVKFMGLRDNYFCMIVEPDPDNYTGFVKKLNAQESLVGLASGELALNPGQQARRTFRIYLGPQELRQITAAKSEWAAVMYYGTFDFIARLLLKLLDLLYSLVHNWGVTIIILSFLIYLLLYPLSIKQMRSMKQMQALQPAIEELKKLHKNNPQKLNTEIMALYREYKVNPLSGCLPMVLQIPIFFALYQVLIRSVALKGANFLWIKDLSSPDRLFVLPTSIPILGNEINILPILMAIGMFFQQKMSMSAVSGGSADQQKLMMIIFPLMFGFIFYRMPSGLVLYWFINSTLMLLQQVLMSRKR